MPRRRLHVPITCPGPQAYGIWLNAGATALVNLGVNLGDAYGGKALLDTSRLQC